MKKRIRSGGEAVGSFCVDCIASMVGGPEIDIMVDLDCLRTGAIFAAWFIVSTKESNSR